jgi:hypothetical protein
MFEGALLAAKHNAAGSLVSPETAGGVDIHGQKISCLLRTSGTGPGRKHLVQPA